LAGDLEYCTLLGHRLHVDLAVYFAALRTMASFLKGRALLTSLQTLFLAKSWSELYLGVRCDVDPGVILVLVA
jgi:hypothetical protein